MARGAYFRRTVATARRHASRTLSANSLVYWHSSHQSPCRWWSSEVTRRPRTVWVTAPEGAPPEMRRTARTSTLVTPVPATTPPREFRSSTPAFVKSAGISNVNGTAASLNRFAPSGSPAALQPASATQIVESVTVHFMAATDTVLKPDHASRKRHFISTDEHEQLRESIRGFVKKEFAPHHEEWEENTFPDSVFPAMGKQGFLGLDKPEELGGEGGDYYSSLVLAEEMVHA